MSKFSTLPEMANYYDDPTLLVYDPRKELRINYEHIVDENISRFPTDIAAFPKHMIISLTKGAIEAVLERVKRNYKTAIPQLYQGKLQLLLPLCLKEQRTADLALVVENYPDFYRGSTCLTLSMAYNNARQICRPDSEWLHP